LKPFCRCAGPADLRLAGSTARKRDMNFVSNHNTRGSKGEPRRHEIDRSGGPSHRETCYLRLPEWPHRSTNLTFYMVTDECREASEAPDHRLSLMPAPHLGDRPPFEKVNAKAAGIPTSWTGAVELAARTAAKSDTTMNRPQRRHFGNVCP